MKQELAEAYIQQVEGRMEKGGVEYQEKNWSADPIKLLGEIQEELADVAGWAGILWGRLQRMKDHLETTRAEDKRKP